MERQRGQCAGGDHEELLLVLDQRVDGSKKACVKFVGEVEIKQPRLTCEELIGVEALAERPKLLRQGIGAERDDLPVEAVAGEREDSALGVAGQKEGERLVGAEQLLRLLQTQGLGDRERRIGGEFLLQPSVVCGEPGFRVGDLPADVVDQRRVLLRIRF